MPIYEYKCRDCDSRFEVLIYSEGARIVCEKCGSENSEKLMSGFACCGSESTPSSSCNTGGRFT